MKIGWNEYSILSALDIARLSVSIHDHETAVADIRFQKRQLEQKALVISAALVCSVDGKTFKRRPYAFTLQRT